MTRPLILLISVCALHGALGAQSPYPPSTDHRALVAHNIAGKEHGFLAGNTLYYIGGQFSAPWRIPEQEAIGFTHPI